MNLNLFRPLRNDAALNDSGRKSSLTDLMNTSGQQLLDAPAFLFAPEAGLNASVIARFLKRRPVGWELRQACELALLARIRADEKALTISSYLDDLARRITYEIGPCELAAARTYAVRLAAASLEQPWQGSANYVSDALSAAKPSAWRRAWPIFSNVGREMALCAENVVRWESWLDRYGVTSDARDPEATLQPRPELVAALAGIQIISEVQLAIDRAPAGSTWRKWFVVPGPLGPTNLWFSTENRMSRARQFVWASLHDAAHILHQHVLLHHPALFVLGAFPYWAVSEAFACSIERRAFSALNSGVDNLLGLALDQLGLDRREVCTVLVESFIEREGRFYRALLTQSPAVGEQLSKAAPRALIEAAGSPSAIDFDALPAMTWYYARGHAAFEVRPESVLELLRFEAHFPHQKEFL